MERESHIQTALILLIIERKKVLILIHVHILQAILGNASVYSGCGNALLFTALTCGVLSIALQLFASGGNYTASFSISKLCLSHTFMTDIKDRVRKPPK